MPVRFQVDPDFYDHPKSIGMSDAATALWVRAGSYSAAKLTDGFIAEHVLVTLTRTPEEAADELTRRGLWRRVKGGYRFHQWDHRNLTKARVEDDKAADRQRKKERRSTARKSAALSDETGTQNASPQVNPGNVRTESRRTPDGIQQESERNPAGSVSVSVSVSESVSGSGSGRPPGGGSGSPPPARCADHLDTPTPGPCGGCAEARKAREQWEADRRRRLADAPTCRKHRGQPAHNCAPCRSEQLASSKE